MIIDFHTHAFADAIAPRAISSLSKASGGLSPSTDGTASGLIRCMDECGVDHSVLLTIATKPKQQKTINDWAASLNSGRISAFGSIHPEDPEALDWLDRLAADGFQGIKLHPEFQDFYADSERAIEIYRRASELGLAVVLHAGRDIGYLPPVKTTPDMLLRAIDRVPDLKLIAAHLGGWMMWDEVANKLVGTPIYFDTAFLADFIEPSLARDIINAHGEDRVLFGSDAPWEDPARTLEFLRSLNLSADRLKKICGENAAGLLGVSL